MTRRRIQRWLWVALPLALGLVLRLWFIAHLARIDGDTLLYGDIAKNWLEHGVYGFTRSGIAPHPTLIRLPGYPLFLAACFRVFGMEHYTAVMVVQSIVDLFTCLVISALAGRLFGRRAAMVALWLAALCPFTANYVAAPLTETLSLACVAIAFYGLERWRTTSLGLNRWLWVIAFALAYALLLRPEQGLLAAAVLAAMLWVSSRERDWVRSAWPVAVVAVCMVLPLAPWAVRNWRTFHVIQPLAPRYATDPGELVPLGFQRWYRSWGIDFASTESVYWNYDSAEIDISDVPSRAFDSEQQYQQTDALLNDYNQTDNATAAVDGQFGKIAEERIHNDPLRYYVALPVARLLNMALRPRTEMMPIPLYWWHWSHPAKSWFAAGYAGLNLVYLVLGGVGFWLWRRRGWDGNPALAWSMMGFVVLRCAVLLTLDNSEPRYTLEFFPVLILWAAVIAGRPNDDRPLSSYRS
ncbi:MULTISPECIES: glycosyltransferase family 39 protein [Acidobacteriaceae]|uniref:ArnT family glycosyltransferase n=1 Tax=Acidobacteriaceae TaxID=204434 RepID=UPI00131BBFE7|nr:MULTISPECIES: glycosyltransferase family 39 protein [Acidobacteriaceae]MDW5266595.1 glycosyltransferase family 39 protein [Edaphobacter sp.]